MLGLTTGKPPKFVKRYANLAEEITRAAGEYMREVGDGSFPGPEHSYGNGAPPAQRAGTPEVRPDEVKYGAGS